MPLSSPPIDVNHYELIDLYHIPTVRNEIIFMYQDLEEELSEEEKEFKEHRDRYYQQLYEDVRPSPALPHESYAVQEVLRWFTLQKFESMDWKLTAIHPDYRPPDYRCRSFTDIPADVIEKIILTETDPEKVVEMKGVRSNRDNRTMDLRFVHYSSTNIFGAVKETFRYDEITRWDMDMGSAFETFFRYRVEQPTLVNAFIAGFAANLPEDDLHLPVPPGTRPADPVEDGMKEETAPRFNGGTPRSLDPHFEFSILKNFMKMPQVSKLMALKLEDIKRGPLQNDIREYHRYKEALQRELLRRDRKMLGGADENQFPQLYWFVLTQLDAEDDHWEITTIEPTPPACENIDELVPLSLYDKLKEPGCDPGTIHSGQFKIPFAMTRKVDVHWVFFSSNCIMGTVRENIDEWRHIMTHKGGGDGEEKVYRRVFRLLRRCPGLAITFLATFLATMPPVLKELDNVRDPRYYLWLQS
jgi:hypothetical protein